MTSSATQPDAPAPLVAAAGLVLVQGIVTVMYGVMEAFHTRSDRIAVGLTTAIFLLVYGLALVVCARGLTRLHGWARGPVLLSELIWLGLAWSFHGDGTWPVSVVMAVPALVVLAGLLHPRSLDALDGSEQH